MYSVGHTDFRAQISDRSSSLVLSEILLRGPLPRTTIAQRTGLTQASVSRITRRLLDFGLIEETGQFADKNRPGRKRVGLGVRPDGGFVAGIAINAFQQDIALVKLSNEVVAEKALKFDDLSQADEVLATCARELNDLIDQSGIDRNRLLGCGVAITGAVDQETGVLLRAPAIDWHDVELRTRLARDIGVPLVLENIPNAKTTAARCFGPIRDVENAVLFNCSLAIGASLFVDGQLWRGANSNIGLVESLLIPDEVTGELKPLDLMAGGYGVIGKSLPRSSVEGYKLAKQLIEVIELESNEHLYSVRTLEQAGYGLAYAIMAVNSFLHPQKILISGPMMESEVYRLAVVERMTQLLGQEFVRDSIQFFTLSSQEAARTLAIHHFLTERGLAWDLLGTRTRQVA